MPNRVGDSQKRVNPTIKEDALLISASQAVLYGWNNPVNPKNASLASFGALDDKFIIAEDLTFYETIKCLARYESSTNPKKMNWNDNGSPSYGLLQFKKFTFEAYCVDKFGFVNVIMNPEIQTRCANYMLKDNYNNITHWTPWRNCYNLE